MQDSLTCVYWLVKSLMTWWQLLHHNVFLCRGSSDVSSQPLCWALKHMAPGLMALWYQTSPSSVTGEHDPKSPQPPGQLDSRHRAVWPPLPYEVFICHFVCVLHREEVWALFWWTYSSQTKAPGETKEGTEGELKPQTTKLQGGEGGSQRQMLLHNMFGMYCTPCPHCHTHATIQPKNACLSTVTEVGPWESDTLQASVFTLVLVLLRSVKWSGPRPHSLWKQSRRAGSGTSMPRLNPGHQLLNCDHRLVTSLAYPSPVCTVGILIVPTLLPSTVE